MTSFLSFFFDRKFFSSYPFFQTLSSPGDIFLNRGRACARSVGRYNRWVGRCCTAVLLYSCTIYSSNYGGLVVRVDSPVPWYYSYCTAVVLYCCTAVLLCCCRGRWVVSTGPARGVDGWVGCGAWDIVCVCILPAPPAYQPVHWWCKRTTIHPY